MQNQTAADCIAGALTEYRNNLYRLAYSYVHNPADAMDVVQETAYKALKNWRSLKDRAGVRPWLYRIAVNTALDALRKARPVTPMEAPPETGTEDDYGHMELAELLDTLSLDERTVVTLHFFEDMKLADVAEVTGRNLNTVKTQLRRALTKLRVELEDGQAAQNGGK